VWLEALFKKLVIAINYLNSSIVSFVKNMQMGSAENKRNKNNFSLNIFSTRSGKVKFVITKSKEIVCLTILLLGFSTSHAHFFDEHARGYWWYEEPAAMDGEPQASKDRILDIQDNPTAIIKKWQKEYDELAHKALVTQSFGDIKAFMHAHRAMIDRSANFAKTWQYVLANNPELNAQVEYPSSDLGRQIYVKEQSRKKERILKEMAKDYGLFFFFSSNCSYCQKMAPIVKNFAKRFGWQVLAISVDGNGLAEFPDFVVNEGQAQTLGITVYPALIALHTKTKKMLPLAYGFTTEEDMANNAMLLMEFIKNA
jgi:conjugal transfer pilus assembly protein TraF